MSRILILGAAGMAGHVIYTVLKESERHEVIGTTNLRSLDNTNIKLDVFDNDSLKKVVQDQKPDVVVNCIGILINQSKEDPAKSIYINAYYPHVLAEICEMNSSKLIHISTDCVFSGSVGGYNEASIKDAVDVYGRTKGLGEVICDKHLTIRTSIIGPELIGKGEGLFDWFMKQTDSVSGYKSAIWSGVTTLELAKFIIWILDNDFKFLVHLTNNQSISKFDLLYLINKVFKKGLTIKDDKDYCIDKSFVNTNKSLDYVVPAYERMLEDQRDFMIKHTDFYSHYGLK